MKATFQEAWGYQGNNMDLPVVDVDDAYKVFFVIAPDGLCYCIGQLIPST